MILNQIVSKMLTSFLTDLENMFYDSNPWVFAIIDKNQHDIFVLKGVTPTFSNLGITVSLENSFSSAQTSPLYPVCQDSWNSHSFFNVSYTWYKSLFQATHTLWITQSNVAFEPHGPSKPFGIFGSFVPPKQSKNLRHLGS